MGEMLRSLPKDGIKINEKLIEATYETIRAGIRHDEDVTRGKNTKESPSGNNNEAPNTKPRHHHAKHKNNTRAKQERFLALVDRKKSDEEGEGGGGGGGERNYRAHEDRRMGILLIGDQQRYSSGASEDYFFLNQPPLDFSFCLLDNVEEITNESETPQGSRSSKKPVRTSDGRYKTSSLRLSYNVITTLEGLPNMCYKILDGGPLGLCWLDLCFNSISKLDVDALSQVPNIRILYLHGNNIGDMFEVRKLAELTNLKSLTLHGNPIEEEDGYRLSVLNFMPQLKTLDFIGVTKGDRANCGFASFYEKHWERRHYELETRAQQLKASQEMSLTERLLKGASDGDDSDVGDLF